MSGVEKLEKGRWSEPAFRMWQVVAKVVRRQNRFNIPLSSALQRVCGYRDPDYRLPRQEVRL